jgi:hypothetical protein
MAVRLLQPRVYGCRDTDLLYPSPVILHNLAPMHTFPLYWQLSKQLANWRVLSHLYEKIDTTLYIHNLPFSFW